MDQLKARANFARICQLLINKGGEALRLVLHASISFSSLTAALKAKKADLLKLTYPMKKTPVINDEQWELLYPTSGAPADAEKFDITLLNILVRNICVPPVKGWHVEPLIADTSTSADVLRIRTFRNKVYGHIPRAELDDPTFETLWKDISEPLIRLRIPQQDIDELKTVILSPEEKSYIDKLKECEEFEDVLLGKVSDVETKVGKVESEVVNLGDKVVNLGEEIVSVKRKFGSLEEEVASVKLVIEPKSKVKQLANFPLTGKIESLCERFQPGTREWFFDKLLSWFSDENRESRVMILIAGPGVGKSVLSAKVCELFKERNQLAAYHFCDFTNSDSCNPNRILQSLASQMCNNLDCFHDKLTQVLDHEHSRDSLSNAFRVLLHDPLHDPALGSHEPMLIVIDAFDESATDDKSEFLELISEKFPLLPKWIKMLISTRPELQVQKKLEHFKPLVIRPEDDDHRSDLLQFIGHCLPDLSRNNVNLLVEKCQGSFLYAYYLVEELKEIDLGIEPDLNHYVPKGISGFYNKQFKRLQTGFQRFKQGVLQIFINVVAASKQPLPIKILLRCMDLSDENYELRQAISDNMSEIFPVYNDCITVYHKSLQDWMTLEPGYEEHVFAAVVPDGNKRLWRVCETIYNHIDSLESVLNYSLTPEDKFALKNGSKFLETVRELDNFHWLVNIKLLFFKLKLYDFYTFTFIRIPRRYPELSDNVFLRIVQLKPVRDIIYRYSHLSAVKWAKDTFSDDKSHETMPMLCYIYLQFLANGYFDFAKDIGCKEKARDILDETNDIWIEEVAKVCNSNFKIISRALAALHRGSPRSVVLSPDKKLLVCSYNNTLELFQLPSLRMTSNLEVDSKGESGVLKFSPDSSYCLFGTIRSCVRITKQKKLKVVQFIRGGPEKICSVSFSSCGNKVVTLENMLIQVWDVRKKALIANFQAELGGPYASDCLFSVCNQYIILSGYETFVVWDLATLEKLESASNICVGSCLKSSDSFQIISPPISSYRSSDLSIGANHFHLPTGEIVLVTDKSISEPFIWKDRKCVVVLNSTSFLAVFDIINKELVDMFQIDCLPIGASIHWVSNLDKANFLVCFGECLVFLVEILSVSSHVNNTAIKCCSISPDSYYIACCFENSILVKSIDNGRILQSVPLKHPPEACWWSELHLWVVCKGVVFKFPYDQSNAEVLGNGVEECNIPFDRVLKFTEGVLVIQRDGKNSLFKICNEKLRLQQIPDSSFSSECVVAISSDGCGIVLLRNGFFERCELWEEVSANRWQLRSNISLADYGSEIRRACFWWTGTSSSPCLVTMIGVPDPPSLRIINLSNKEQSLIPFISGVQSSPNIICLRLHYLIALFEGWIYFINTSDGKIIGRVYLGVDYYPLWWYYVGSRETLVFVEKNDIRFFKIHNIENYLESDHNTYSNNPWYYAKSR